MKQTHWICPECFHGVVVEAYTLAVIGTPLCTCCEGEPEMVHQEQFTIRIDYDRTDSDCSFDTSAFFVYTIYDEDGVERYRCGGFMYQKEMKSYLENILKEYPLARVTLTDVCRFLIDGHDWLEALITKMRKKHLKERT